MMGTKRTQRGTVALAAAAALLAAGGVAYATIPDSSGVIHGCFKTNSGSLRVIDTGGDGACSTGETPLDWNQTGPQGPQGAAGPQGAQGPQGPQGPAGTSHAYSDHAGLTSAAASPSSSTVTSVSLPSGDYEAWATGTAEHTSGSDNDVKCELVAGGSSLTEQELEPTWDDTAREPYSLAGTASLPSGGTISLVCWTETGSVGTELDDNDLVVSAVGALN